jgi:hypothetical protein
MWTALNGTTATFADDTAVMASGETVENSTRKLQWAVNKVAIWTREMANKTQWIQHIDSTNKKIRQQPIFIIGTQVAYANAVKCLGMTLDAKLRWKKHIENKRDELNIKFRKIYCCLDAILSCQSTINSYYTSKLYIKFGVMVSSFGAVPAILILKWSNITKTKCRSVLSTHLGTFELVTFILISGSKWLQISSLSSPTLMKTDFKTTSTSKHPDFPMWTISTDDTSRRNHLNWLDVKTLIQWKYLSFNYLNSIIG